MENTTLFWDTKLPDGSTLGNWMDKMLNEEGWWWDEQLHVFNIFHSLCESMRNDCLTDETDIIHEFYSSIENSLYSQEKLDDILELDPRNFMSDPEDLLGNMGRSVLSFPVPLDGALDLVLHIARLAVLRLLHLDSARSVELVRLHSTATFRLVSCTPDTELGADEYLVMYNFLSEALHSDRCFRRCSVELPDGFYFVHCEVEYTDED